MGGGVFVQTNSVSPVGKIRVYEGCLLAYIPGQLVGWLAGLLVGWLVGWMDDLFNCFLFFVPSFHK